MKKFLTLALTAMLTLSFASQSNATKFIEGKIVKIETDLPKVLDVDVCVGDVDENGHRDTVSQYVYKYFGGNIKKLDYSMYYPYENEKCDVINHSIGLYPILNGETEYENEQILNEYIEYEANKVNVFLKYHKWIIVESAGNNGKDSKVSSSLARYKDKYKNYEVNERLFVVGQIEKTKSGDYIHHFNYGDEVDFVVANYNEYVKGGHYSGTSFASPVVSGVIATLLESGIPQEDIRDVIGYEDEVHVYKGKEYKVFSAFNTFKNARDYIDSKETVDKN